MMSSVSRIAFTVALVAIPISAAAQRHGGGGGGGGRGGGGGGGMRSAPAPISRPAPAPARPAGPAAGSFNFNHDIAPAPAPARPAPAAPRPAPVAQRPPVTQPAPATRPGPATDGSHNVAYHRAPVSTAATGGAFRGNFNGHPIENNHWHGNWAWNHGRPWNPAPLYWGGGFWGDFAIASIGALGIYGAIEDSQDGYEYDSYQVQPDTPGADLLADYNLQQVECGPPGLVDIWGPDGSVICATPNDAVGPGDYEVDPQTFTLVPAT